MDGPRLNTCPAQYIIDSLLPRPRAFGAPTAMLPSGSTSSHFDPFLVTGQDSNCTSIAWAMSSVCCSYPLLSALNENQQPTLEAGTVIGANHGAFQAQSDNTQDSFDPLLNFDPNVYYYGLSGFSPFQPSLSVLGGPSGARTPARSVFYNKLRL